MDGAASAWTRPAGHQRDLERAIERQRSVLRTTPSFVRKSCVVSGVHRRTECGLAASTAMGADPRCVSNADAGVAQSSCPLPRVAGAPRTSQGRCHGVVDPIFSSSRVPDAFRRLLRRCRCGPHAHGIELPRGFGSPPWGMRSSPKRRETPHATWEERVWTTYETGATR